MTNFEQIIEYQKLDAELRRINNEYNKHPDKRKLDAVRNDFNAAQAVFDKSLAESEGHAKEIEQIYADFKTSESEIAELEKAFAAAATDEEKAGLLPKMELVKAKLDTCRNKIIKKTDAIKHLLGVCAQEQAKKKNVKAEFDKINARLKTVKDSFMPERNGIKGKMAELENTLDKNLLEIYSKARKDGIFPVFVKATVTDGGDYGCLCGMQLSQTNKTKLKNEKMCQCDACRRIVYTD